METRANNVFVGAVTLALLVALAIFVVWIARLNEGAQKEYDIFFRQSVSGLSKGSSVTFNGVPAGQIEDIELWTKDPSFVRVRIQIDKKIPVLIGTTASIQGSFTGVSNILLEGVQNGGEPITEPGPGPGKVPVIPTKRGGLGEILNNAPVLLERLATLTERVNLLLGDENQQSIKSILANTDRLTGNLADASPEVKATIVELRGTLAQATATLANFEKVADTANHQLSGENGTVMRELRESLSSVRRAIDQLEGTLNDARPAVRQLSNSTLPAADAALRDLRATSRARRHVTEKIDEQGAGALIGSDSGLPDYKP